MTFRHILVPIDFRAPSDHAVDIALEMAAPVDAQVTLAHVVWIPPYYYLSYADGLHIPVAAIENAATGRLDEAVARAQARYPRTDGMLATGIPWESILDAAKAHEADLIVMGTHGRHGLSRAFLGSVAEKIVRHSPIPVLTTPGRAPAEAAPNAAA